MSRYDHVTPEDVERELAETAATLPIYADLPDLFTDRKMFDSYEQFADEGFRLVEHAEHKIMSGFHKSASGYIFKKYSNDKPGDDQLLNYMFRIEGARRLRAFIAERGFSGVVAPRKWLYELPSSFPERYLVVAERFELVSKRSTERSYDDIDQNQMRELATILYYFRGLNSSSTNLPFTEDGRIAFIDTERWHHEKDYLRKVGDRLPGDRRRLAGDIYNELASQGARPFESAYRHKKRRRRDENDRREADRYVVSLDNAAARRDDDFDDEEDTSPSSSSSSSSSSS
jgi:hypothetical protein